MIVDWTTAPGNWPKIGPEIAASLKRIATMPLEELRAMPDLPLRFSLMPRIYPRSIADVQVAVCEEFTIPRAKMLADIQTKEITIPRQIAMYLAREVTNKTFYTIGRSFNRDHTTIAFAYRAIQKRIENGWLLAPVVARLRAELAP